MTCKVLGALILAGGLLAPVIIHAHHAVQSQFDFDKPIEMTGTLAKMEWINPHSQLHLAVKDDSGKVTVWQLETVGPGGLKRAGLSRTSRGGLSAGDPLKIKGYASRDGSATAFLRELTLKDGRVVTIWFGDPNAN
jgi:hypothetical protein